MSYSTIQFRFLMKVGEGNATDNAKDDHTVSIYRNKDQTGPRFLWVFSDGGATRQVSFMKDEDTVLDAVRNMFRLLAWDTEPYARIQIFAPGFPSPLLRMSDVDRFGPDVSAMLRTVFRSWSENMKPADANELVRLFRDEGMEAEEDEESEAEEDDETAEYEADEDSEEESPCANCPRTPERPPRQRECPGAPARAAWRDILEDPACPGTSNHTLRVRRTVTETPEGPRVHLTFE